MRAPSCPAQRGRRRVLRPPPQLLLGTSLPLRVTPPPFCAALPTFCFSAPLYSPGAGRWHGGSSRQKRAPGAGLASGPLCPPGTHSWNRGYHRSKACPPAPHEEGQASPPLPNHPRGPCTLHPPPGGSASPPRLPCVSDPHGSPGVLGNSGNGGQEAGSGCSWAGGRGAQVPWGQEGVHQEVGQEGFRLEAGEEGVRREDREVREQAGLVSAQVSVKARRRETWGQPGCGSPEARTSR